MLDDIALINIALIIVFVIAGVSVVQFYKGRRKNLRILESSIRALEKILEPKDKNYVIIGIYVGYNAIYKIFRKTLTTAEATILLLPRQSLLYMPVAKLASRFDRVFLAFNYSRDMFVEAHVVKKGYYRLGIRHVIKGISKMKIERIKINGKDYYLVYTQRSMAQKLLDFVKSLNNPLIINHIAIVPSIKRLYIAAKLDMHNFIDFLRKSTNLALDLA